ncbi:MULTISPECIES: cupredoxin domain-containing protein [Colwellia]|uniref:Copper-binding protein, plastocyanin/azurin family n=1 Tax=Colwellia psychrerythraea (strain 34H / ATCC BAA-681) TaxID=167879 RepID=Q489B5_COLP3|nr:MULTISPECIES: plastocyanin/azurin family copper-binding protein [Colwellia]AAZ25073.1 copper-binding protein, plastocyanin/azurin family [Colwellia psychrerythraea 34H]
MIDKRVWLFMTMSLFIGTSQVQAKDVIVEIYKKQFIPSEVTIEAGDRVIWKNIEKRQYHNVWFKGSGEEEPDYFFPDESYQRQFDQLGTFAYECGPHPKMKGKVIVKKSQQ